MTSAAIHSRNLSRAWAHHSSTLVIRSQHPTICSGTVIAHSRSPLQSRCIVSATRLNEAHDRRRVVADNTHHAPTSSSRSTQRLAFGGANYAGRLHLSLVGISHHRLLLFRTTGSTVQPSEGEFQGRAAALHVTWLGFGANLGLSGFKYVAGVLTGSSVLIADAAHSLSDLVSDFVTLFVLQYARMPADEKHPYGHGRFEALGSLAVSAVLIGTAGGVGWNALSMLLECWQHAALENSILSSGYGGVAILACVTSLATKEALYHATVRVGRDINSQTLIANAWHHRSDALSSVAALVGVGGSLVGLPILDPLSGLLVSGLVAKAGAEIGWESAQELVEKAESDDATLQGVREIAKITEGVLGVQQLRARKMGPFSLVDLHMDVEPLISVSAAHHVAERLRRRIISSQQNVSEVLVHVHPFAGAEIDHAMRPYTEVERDVRDMLSLVPEIGGVAHIIVHYVPKEGIHVKVDLVLDLDITVRKAHAIARNAKHALLQLPDVSAVDVDMELDV